MKGPWLLLLLVVVSTHSFVTPSLSRTPSFLDAKRNPSRVSDPDGPTPTVATGDIDTIEAEDVDELRAWMSEEDVIRPIEHQPWRLGDTAGCDDPIAAPWRKEAEELIYRAVDYVGGQVLDVTWFLTQVIVTIDDQVMPPRDLLKSRGPQIEIITPEPPEFKDPADPNPEEIWEDEDGALYVRQTEEEKAAAVQTKKNMYATKNADDPEDEAHIPDHDELDDLDLFANEEYREDVALHVAEEEQTRYEELEKPIDTDTLTIDTAALSTIGQAILDALEERENNLEVLTRHELLLASPGPEDVIETQKQFDQFRGSPVIVETQDPFDSNRTLKGRLVDRNAMDVMINKQGRLVTIPNNFVRMVRLPRSSRGRPEDEGFE